jgi:uncharacterized FAD-dependent dehydrogenase
VAVYLKENLLKKIEYDFQIMEMLKCTRSCVVGAGPAGLFAALQLIELA